MFNEQLENGNQIALTKDDLNKLTNKVKHNVFNLYEYQFQPGDTKCRKRNLYLYSMLRVLAIFDLYIADSESGKPINAYSTPELSDLSIIHKDEYKMSQLDVDEKLGKACSDLFYFDGFQNSDFESYGSFDYEGFFMCKRLFQEVVIAFLDNISQVLFNKPLVNNIKELKGFPVMQKAYKRYLNAEPVED